MQKLAQGTAERLVAQGIIREEDAPIYRYGLEAMYSSLLELLSILALAALIGNFWQTVLFFAAFIPLRLYAGGYHASTRLRCFLTSLVVYAAFTIMLEIVPVAWFVPLAFIGGAVSFLIVWLFAPVIHQNHRSGLKHQVRFRRISVRICVVEVSAIIVGQILWSESALFFAALLGLLAEALSILAVKSQSVKQAIVLEGRE
mgnify:FL=1